jgi:glycosyltransferase involved in cell wall biosynthesis
MTAKITAIIPTYNEEQNIRGAIESCSFADEIIVVDSFSQDDTAKIVRKEFPHVKLLEHEYKYSAAQKNWTIPQASHEWIFLLDADERTSDHLINEIKQVVNSPEHTAYWIPRVNCFMGKELKFAWRGDAVIRLFKRDQCHYEDKHVHAEILTDGSIGRLKNSLKHDTYQGKGLESHVIKNYRYSTWAAHDRVHKIKRITFYHLLIKPLFAFFKRYILQGGIFDGRQGFIIAMFGMWSVFLRNVKIWRMHEGEKIEAK